MKDIDFDNLTWSPIEKEQKEEAINKEKEERKEYLKKISTEKTKSKETSNSISESSNLNKEQKVKGKDYYEILLQAKNSTKYSHLLEKLPLFYRILCNIVENKKSPWYAKMLADVGLSYLVIEEDIIPEKESADGYLDDLFLCAYVLKEIRDNISVETVLNNLPEEIDNKEEFLSVIYETVNETGELLGKKTDEILDFVGLSEFGLFDLYYNGEDRRLKSRKNKLKLLYAMVAVQAKDFLKKDAASNREKHMKSYIREHPEFIEIRRFMEFDNI